MTLAAAPDTVGCQSAKEGRMTTTVLCRCRVADYEAGGLDTTTRFG
jgi:hypothetical protein